MEGATWERITLGVLGTLGTLGAALFTWMYQKKQAQVNELSEQVKASAGVEVAQINADAAETKDLLAHDLAVSPALLLRIGSLENGLKECDKHRTECLELHADTKADLKLLTKENTHLQARVSELAGMINQMNIAQHGGQFRSASELLNSDTIQRAVEEQAKRNPPPDQKVILEFQSKPPEESK